MDLLLKTQIGRYEATLEDFAIYRELAPLLSDVLARDTIGFLKKAEKDLSYFLVACRISAMLVSYREETIGRFLAHTFDSPSFKNSHCILHNCDA